MLMVIVFYFYQMKNIKKQNKHIFLEIIYINERMMGYIKKLFCFN